MSDPHTSEFFPLMSNDGREFELALRGYDRHQVDDYVSRSEAELALLAQERDSATDRSADLAAQLANSHAQIESMRRYVTQASAEVTPENVQARVRPIVELAQAQARGIRDLAEAEADRLRQLANADAAETRRQADADAARTRAQAQADLDRAAETAVRHGADADAHAAQARAQTDEYVNRARAAAEQIRADAEGAAAALTARAEDERDRLDAESAARRALIDEDFEIALRLRRTAETQADAQRRAESHAESTRLVDDALAESDRLLTMARAEAARVTAEATAQVDHLSDLRDRVQADLSVIHTRMGRVLADAAAIPIARVPVETSGPTPPGADQPPAAFPPIGQRPAV